jgi:hypothetical protein
LSRRWKGQKLVPRTIHFPLPPKESPEVTELKREVGRLKDIIRSAEQVDDEVWVQDGRIFYKHRCNGALLEQEISKGWKITSSGTITPSFSCPACRAHFHATVIVQLQRAGWAKPADWAPRWNTNWSGGLFATSAREKAQLGKEHSVDRQDRNTHGHQSYWDSGL